MNLIWLIDGLRIVSYSFKRNIFGFTKYSGNIKSISKQIINSSFNGEHFMVSSGHFKQFYSRDFGMICESLINLGYEEEVRKTLIYVMDKFVEADTVTTHFAHGKPVDFPNFSPESVAYMLHSLILLNDGHLLYKYSVFFRKMSEKIYKNDIDKKTGLLRKDKFFSSMKDYSLRQSDCYNNCMLGMFANDLKKLGVVSSLHKYDYKKLIKNHFWTGSYFLEDLSGKKIISGDANTFPFWTGLFDDKEMFKKCLKSIQSKKLDSPWPLKYTAKKDVPDKKHFADKLVPGYEDDAVWMHLGICYLKVVSKFDKKLLKKYLKQYESLIKKHKNFLEVYFPDGSPFKRPLYVSDEAMSWVAQFLELFEKS